MQCSVAVRLAVKAGCVPVLKVLCRGRAPRHVTRLQAPMARSPRSKDVGLLEAVAGHVSIPGAYMQGPCTVDGGMLWTVGAEQ